MPERLRFRAAGAEAVEQTWRTVVPSAQLQRADPRQFEFEWSSATLDGMTVVAYELEASVRSAVDPQEQLMVCRLMAADGGAWDVHGPLDARQPWASADLPVRARWDGRARVHALVFDLPIVQRAARAMTGDDRLPLNRWDARPVNAASARQWQRTYRYLADSFLADDEGPGALAEAELRRHAMHATLMAFSAPFVESTERSVQTRAAPATVRRALSYIDRHAQDPITIDDVARAAGISSRGLQYAFRRALDTTPVESLRRARLAGAHRDLLDPQAGTIGEIARRWGFENPSRFAAHYRAAHGVNPSQTTRAYR